MNSSKINEAVKEAVITEVKKLTDYNPSTPNQLFQHLEGNFSVKYVPDIFLRIAVGDLVIFFSPRVSPTDLIWQKAAEMLKICWEVQKTEDAPKRKKVFNSIVGIALFHLKWWLQSLDEKVTDDESIGYVKFWGGVKNTYGENIPSNETSNLIDAKVKKGCTRREYLELIVDEIMAQSADNPPKKETPEYIPPTPPVNPVEHALTEIDKLKIRVAELESMMMGVKEAFYNAEETPEFVDRLKNYASNPATFNTFWKKKFGAKEETTPDYTPTREQCEALWLLVKDGDKSFPNALPYKVVLRPFQPNTIRIEVDNTFAFILSRQKFCPIPSGLSRERPTFDQCRQAIAGTLAATLETLFNDEVK